MAELSGSAPEPSSSSSRPHTSSQPVAVTALPAAADQARPIRCTPSGTRQGCPRLPKACLALPIRPVPGTATAPGSTSWEPPDPWRPGRRRPDVTANQDRSHHKPRYSYSAHYSWERGTNENTNGIIREYFPKGTEIPSDPEYLWTVADSLMTDRLLHSHFRKPSGVFAELMLQEAKVPPA